MDPVSIIRRKRDGLELASQEVSAFIEGIVQGAVPDYQTAAFLMAAVCRGLNKREITAMTLAMRDSGSVLTWNDGPAVIDKHSTGGVGDGVSFIALPICAALGLRVPSIAGRGLGHTGGTIDKLEALPGFNTTMCLKDFRSQVERIGLAIVAQTQEIAPADGILYAIRDVTGTVESPGLIVASILSKKLAEGLNGLVMDVKTGSGAFLQRQDQAVEMAELLQFLGKETGLPVSVLVTNMDQPLGQAIGNALEVAQAMDILVGKVVDETSDLVAVSLAVAARMLLLAGKAKDVASAEYLARQALEDGKAFKSFWAMAKAQGADLRYLDEPQRLRSSARRIAVPAGKAGYVSRLDAKLLGQAAMLLGAGRRKKGDAVDPGAGIHLLKKIGAPVEPGEPLMELFVNDEANLDQALALVSNAVQFSEKPIEPPKLILAELPAIPTHPAS